MRKGSLVALALLVMLFIAWSGLGEDGYPRRLVDSAGREIEIRMPVERIVVQSGYAAEAVKALGAEDKIIGVTETIHNRPEIYPYLKDKQVVGTWNTFDYELIGEIARSGDTIVPDIIVICYSYGTSKGKSYAVDSFEKGFAPFQNITLIGLDFTNPENITDSMSKLGTILDREEEADSYNRWYMEKLSEIEDSVRDLPLKTVFIESGSSSGTSELTAYGSGSGFSSLVRLAGGINVADDIEDRFPKVSWEWVITQNPDVILKYRSADTLGWETGPSSDTVDLEKTRNEILGRAGAETVNAVKNNQVYLCFSEMLYGLDSPVGLAYMAKLLHPEADVDPEEIWEEYNRIMGLDPPDNRIFVYPAVAE